MSQKTETLNHLKPCQESIKYCSSYDEDCKDINDPHACFIGGLWACSITGRVSYFDLADGVCKEMEIRRKEK